MNTIAEQIASVTKQINTVELTGVLANDLRDKRNLMLDELSSIVPITVTETEFANGHTNFMVKTEGFTLVDDYDAKSMVLVEREHRAGKMDADGLYDIYYYYDEETGSGTKFDPIAMDMNGALRAMIDVRDGNNAMADTSNPYAKNVNYKGIPFYVEKIQDFKQTIADTFNDIHQHSTITDEDGNEVPANYNLYGDTTEDIPIYIMSSTGVLSVNKDLIDDPSLLATSTYPIQNGVEDSGIIDRLLAVRDKPIFRNSNAQEYLHSIVAEISVDVSKADSFERNYSNIKQSIENQRLSYSGVDGDEEAMDLVKYQEAFDLAAKMISVMQQIYNKLINEM